MVSLDTQTRRALARHTESVEHGLLRPTEACMRMPRPGATYREC
jgi:hypothetical protein